MAGRRRHRGLALGPGSRGRPGCDVDSRRCRPAGPAGPLAGGLLAAPQHQPRLQLGHHRGVGGGGDLGQGGHRPADPAGLGHLQTQLAGQGGIAAVVVAAAAAGVLDAPGVGQPMGGLVQQRGHDLTGPPGQALPADQDLRVLAAGVLPAPGGEVAPLQAAAAAAGGDHQHGLGDLGMAGADGRPGVLQGSHQGAGVADGHSWSSRRR
jgi:hypothetical protein